MEREIVPEPPEEQREAIDAAVARLLADPEDPHDEWWRTGVREALNPEEEPA